MESANQRIVKYVIPIFVLSIIIGTMFLSDSFEALGQKEDNKEKVINENQKKENKIKQLGRQTTLDYETSVAKLQGIGIENMKKIHPRVLDIIIDENPAKMAKQHGAKFQYNKLDTYIYLKQEYIDDPPKNIKVLAKSENILVSKLSFDEIQQLAALESVERIGLPIKAKFFGHATSEGVAFSFADDLVVSGVTGDSFALAIIDSGFDISNPEISGNIISTSFDPLCGSSSILCDDTLNESHGTAVAEIIVDMAPDVNLRLFAITDLVAFNNAVDDAIALQVKIITASVGFPTLGGDGTNQGFFRDGTSSAAKKVNEATAAGILVTVAAGNQGDSHWQGNYTISPVNPSSIPGLSVLGIESVMDFDPSLGPTDTMRACLPVNDKADFYFASWNAWATTTEDYDLFLYSSDMSTFLAFSADDQAGMNIEPIEFFSWLNVGDSCLVLASFSSSENHFFHINTESNTLDPSFQIRAGSIDTPADASGALTVGAIDHNTDFLEDFSSSGPTDDDRPKPEICGPDRTLTHQTQLNPPIPGIFPGTSAATPHVAGAAMLLLDQNSLLTATQISNKLINDARFNAAYSVDNLCGLNSGALSIPAPPDPPCSPPVSGNWTVTSSCILESDAVIEGNVIVQNNSVITIPSGVTLDIDFENNFLQIKFGSGVRIKAGGTLT